MGQSDREYMNGQEPGEGEGSGLVLLVWVGIWVITFVVMFLVLRLPVPFPAKIVAGILVFFGLRKLWRVPSALAARRLCQMAVAAEKEDRMDKAVYCYEEASGLCPDDVILMVKLLSVYNHTLRVVKAKALIRKLEGKRIPESMQGEVSALISEYRPVQFEASGKGMIIRLG